MRRVPRHIFIDEALRSRAYENMSLPIGFKQTISQPYIVAKMTELLVKNSKKQNEKFEKILEIGSGCGYQSAVLSYFADEVHSVERIKQLVSKARENLSELRIYNVLIKNRDGFEGWDEEIKYDGILCAAAPPEIPKKLLAFLKVGCSLVLPVGGSKSQKLKIVTKTKKGFEEQEFESVSFVPMLGGTSK